MTHRKPSPESEDLADLERLVERMRAGERRAISRAVTELERFSPAAPGLLEAMRPHLGHAIVIGVTGPPGAGKSTLLDAYTRHLRQGGKSVGIVAVDPSSPISGGAILGDRIRMTAALDDDGVFMRSLASRGYLGGLTPAAVRVIDAFDAAGKDVILIETVGTGQADIDVAEIADVRIVVTAPGLGDDIQAMKSGLLEIADILVVNKADRDGAAQTAQQLEGALSLKPDARAKVPVLKVTAKTGEGIAGLAAAIDAVVDGVRAGSEAAPQARRRRRARYLIARAAADMVAERIRRGSRDAVDALADEVLAGTLLPDEAARRLVNG
jgi:LAO/AO transport system kinase